jgi:hypothetical protein
MEISISKMVIEDGEKWLVNTGAIKLNFKDQASAVEFTEKLKERIEAPHMLPSSALEPITSAFAVENV